MIHPWIILEKWSALLQNEKETEYHLVKMINDPKENSFIGRFYIRRMVNNKCAIAQFAGNNSSEAKEYFDQLKKSVLDINPKKDSRYKILI